MKIRKNQQMPEEVIEAFNMLAVESSDTRNAYMRVLRDKGWTYQSIADAIGDLGRERVRQCVESIDLPTAIETLTDNEWTLPIPDIPDAPEPPEKVLRVRPMPTPEDLQRLRELKPVAARVRYNHSKNRSEAEEYVSLLWKVHSEDGVSVYRLGKLLDILPSAIESRFVRYGYKDTGGSSANYAPVKYRST